MYLSTLKICYWGEKEVAAATSLLWHVELFGQVQTFEHCLMSTNKTVLSQKYLEGSWEKETVESFGTSARFDWYVLMCLPLLVCQYFPQGLSLNVSLKVSLNVSMNFSWQPLVRIVPHTTQQFWDELDSKSLWKLQNSEKTSMLQISRTVSQEHFQGLKKLWFQKQNLLSKQPMFSFWLCSGSFALSVSNSFIICGLEFPGGSGFSWQWKQQ